ncbi:MULTISPECIES: hypothetical protein [unclassified Methylibium]|uniref:hypothetical protein n=1 Tax=unclassified Methylibium TaxID=2633235 RepID=UPI0003F44FBC|nr:MULTISPECIES: hypothetical protein [unclassified Methylibium]EWS57025.1 hypothetical protein X551_00159 [Methylibium sp. T29]EWS62223.1 hypothetical protein Y694_00066 [Methylibium sp. T29-B]
MAQVPLTGGASALRAIAPEASIALFALLVNFPWEMLQAPLFAGHAQAPHLIVVLSCLQATVGDAAIMLVAHGLASWFAGDRRWLLAPTAADLARLSTTGIVVTVGIEWFATRGWWVQAWSYSALMPVVPGLGVGLAPLVQWFILPPLVAWLAKRHLHGTLSIGRTLPGRG